MNRMRRGYLAAALVCVVLALLLLAVAVGAANARVMACTAWVYGATADAAAQELRGYASQLQSDEIHGATMGHIMQLLDLAERLDEAPRTGCDAVSW